MHSSAENTTPSQSPGSDRAQQLREQIAELRKRWPPHSVPPSLLQRLEDLEEALEIEMRKRTKHD